MTWVVNNYDSKTNHPLPPYPHTNHTEGVLDVLNTRNTNGSVNDFSVFLIKTYNCTI